MKLSGRLLMLILIAILIQWRAPLVTGVQAQGNEQTVTLNGVYTGWVEIDIGHSWDSPAPDLGLVENYFSFNYVRSRGMINLGFVSGKPQRVNIVLSLPFYMIARQRIVPPPGAPNLCQGYHIFVNGSSHAEYNGGADGNSMLFQIRGFTFMPSSKGPTVIPMEGDCDIPSARQAALEAAEIEAMLPETFPWKFETTHWTKDQFSIGGSCSSAEYEQLQDTAVQCFWGANKIPDPTPLVKPPRKR